MVLCDACVVLDTISSIMHFHDRSGPNAMVGTHLCGRTCINFHSSNQHHNSHNKSGSESVRTAIPFLSNSSFFWMIASRAEVALTWYQLLFFFLIKKNVFISYITRLLFHCQSPGLNIITEYIMGVILPGRPIANVCFKTYGYISMAQAVSFLSDFKLGHYMKIPPRSMFIAQVNTLEHAFYLKGNN